MADPSVVFLLTSEQRTSEAANKLEPFLREAANRTGLSVTMTARDDVTGGLLATLRLDQKLMLRFLTHLREMLPAFGELVPLRVAVHAGGLVRGLPDEFSLAVLHQLAAATIRTMSDSRFEVLISEQVVKYFQPARAALREISVMGEQAWLWRGAPEKPAHAICSLALILNGRQVITGHVDGVIRRWDTSTGAPAGKPFTRHSAEVCAIAVTPDGEQVVSGDFDGVICRWHAATLEPIGDRPSMQNGPVLAVAAAPDGQQFFTGAEDGRLLIWNIADGRRTRGLGSPAEPLRAIAVSPDGRAAASGGRSGTIARWNLTDDVPFRIDGTNLAEGIHTLAFSPDGDNLVSGGDRYIRVSRMSAEKGWPVHSTVLAIAVTPDGERIVSGSADGALRLWELATGEPIGAPWIGHQGGVSALAVTPDGRLIVSGGADGELRRWDARTGTPVTEAEQLAEVASDMESEEDQLGIANDVRTIATVLAAVSTQPPLSIALLGDWGAGKSSFMRQLRAKVSQLSTSDAQHGDRNAFVGNVRQVTFNAWHYSDDHLWVGLIERLFLELADAPDPGRVGELEARLTSDEAEQKRLRRDLATIPLRSALRYELRGWRLWVGIAILLAGVAVIVFGSGVLAWVAATVALLGPVIGALSGLWRYVTASRQKLLERKATVEHDIEATTAQLAALDPTPRLERLLTEITAEDRYASFRGLTGRIHHDLRRLSTDLADARTRWDGTGSPPLQRIVLYVDDLDRCPASRVADVLQAVNLLLTMDLFMVVVAVDPKWLLRSLRSHHGQDSQPVVYLDKIFHIPFALRPMGEHATDFLLSLLPQESMPDVPETDEPATVAEPAERQPDLPQPVAVFEPEVVIQAPPAALTAAGLRVTAAERAFLARLTPLLTTPRAVKKLANLYRLLRLSVPPDELPDFLDGPYQAAALLLAALAGEPTGARALLTMLAESKTDKDIVDTLGASNRLAELILNLREDLPVHSDTATYRQWATEVARFGFETYDLYAC